MGDDDFKDVVLQMHRCKPRCYELAGTRTANVRDQLLRATHLVTKLCEGPAPELTARDPLLIIGGGAAGVAAALIASVSGVPCVLLEKRERLFECQWEVTSRWLDPTEFDWPHPGWKETNWPPENVAPRWTIRSPLIYEDPGPASVLASSWQETLRAWIDDELNEEDGDGPIHVMTERDRATVKIDFFDDYITAASLPGHAALPIERFGALISCVGLGDEKVLVDQYAGSLFWSTDLVATRHLGLTNDSDIPSIEALVSGGGDGAQQDVLRVLCGNFGRRLLGALGYDLTKFDTSALARADQVRHTALVAAGTDVALAEAAMDAWDEVYSEQALQFWQGLSEKRAKQVIENLLRPEVRSGEVHLTWLLRGERPTYCYGLNRFLIEVALHAYAAQSRRPLRADRADIGADVKDVPIVLLGHELAGISSAYPRHACKGDHLRCREHLHRAFVRPTGATGTTWPSRFVHLMVIRHGLGKAALFGGAPVTEQRMPYWLPDH